METREKLDESIAATALDLFGSQGYHSTSMEQIRRDVGVSNGSLYYLFPSKAALAARLYCDGMIQCQDGIRRELVAATSAEAGIRGSVAFQTSWVDDHVHAARIIYTDLPDEVLIAAAPQLDAPNRSYVRAVNRWVRVHVDAGSLIDRSFPVLHALWLGPTQEFCRHWVRGRGRLRPRDVADDLADGAWRAVSTR
ncbi:MAG: transcriptional regulatory protein [Ilumatobacteraceae bacterium]|jgi:AcrR family transcriptional regulator|nr:transcriptional regulatory protein [Ilumatobacteraceae bacterium]